MATMGQYDISEPIVFLSPLKWFCIQICVWIKVSEEVRFHHLFLGSSFIEQKPIQYILAGTVFSTVVIQLVTEDNMFYQCFSLADAVPDATADVSSNIGVDKKNKESWDC